MPPHGSFVCVPVYLRLHSFTPGSHTVHVLHYTPVHVRCLIRWTLIAHIRLLRYVCWFDRCVPFAPFVLRCCLPAVWLVHVYAFLPADLLISRLPHRVVFCRFCPTSHYHRTTYRYLTIISFTLPTHLHRFDCYITVLFLGHHIYWCVVWYIRSLLVIAFLPLRYVDSAVLILGSRYGLLTTHVLR